eukprot:jgi/Botrbrau1/7385/Bobra.0316s0028.1
MGLDCKSFPFMPISPKYEWDQTPEEVQIRLDVVGRTVSDTHLDINDATFTFISHPYLLKIDLYANVIPDQCSARFTSQQVSCVLVKAEQSDWPSLDAKGEKMAIICRRENAREKSINVENESSKKRLSLWNTAQKASVEQQLQLENRKTSEISSRKKEELEKERTQLAHWQAQIGLETDEDSDDEEQLRDDRGQEPYFGKGWKPIPGRHSPSVSVSSTDEHTHQGPSLQSGVPSKRTDAQQQWTDHNASLREVTPHQGRLNREKPTAVSSRPRKPLSPVCVDFTALETQHLPARQKREEDIRAYRKTTLGSPHAGNKDLRDRHPAYLKEQGDNLFRQKKLLGGH